MIAFRTHLENFLKNPYFFSLLIFAIFFAAVFYFAPPPRGDWERTFYRAGQNWLNVYEGHQIHYVYPPWLAVLLIPFAQFSSIIGGMLWRAFSVIVVGLAIKRFGGDIKSLAFTFCTPFFYAHMVYGQIDAMILLGLALATYSMMRLRLLGILLILIKPQVAGFALLIFFLREKRRLLLIGLLSFVFLVTFIIWGFWPLDVYSMMSRLSTRNSVDVWPHGLLLGIPLLIWSLWQDNLELAVIATYLCVPYANLQSLVPLSALVFAKSSLQLSVALLVLVWGLLIFSAAI